MTWHFCMFTAFLLMCGGAGAAKSERLYLDWEALRPAVAGRVVSVALPSGATPRGRVVQITPENLILDVAGRGPMSIGRPYVSVLRIEKVGVRGRVVGTIMGALAGVAAGFGLATAFADTSSPEAISTAAAVIAIAGGTGYSIGRWFDKNSTYIVVQHYPHHVLTRNP